MRIAHLGLSQVCDRSKVETTGVHQMLRHPRRNEAPVDRLTESNLLTPHP